MNRFFLMGGIFIGHYMEAQLPDRIEEVKAKIENSIVLPSIPEYRSCRNPSYSTMFN